MGITGTFHQLISICFPETIEQYTYKILNKIKTPRNTWVFFYTIKILPPHKPIILQEHCTVKKYLAERSNDI